MKSANTLPKNASPFLRDLTLTLAINFIVAVIVTLVFAYPSSGLSGIAASFVPSLIISNCIGLLILLILTLFERHIESRAFPLNWVLRICALILGTAIGFLIGGAILAATGLMPQRYYWSAFRYGIGFSLLITLVIGIGLYMHESLRAKLEAANLRLREKELAEERARKLAVEAQLSSLESRIHPHFLFNTLNSISSLIQEDPRQAERMVERLAALLRFSLESNQTSTVPLNREIKVVGDYLEIEKARFGSRLRYSISVPSEFESIEVPPLAVQTIVENSLKHSISQRREGGEVRIQARASDNRVVIEVGDDGPGFSSKDITLGHGLDNLQSRLAALFDDDAGLSVTTADGRTVVAFWVPQAQPHPVAAL
jgi:sensor histidine kinase YesM